jgi:NAD(P)H-flavin reductase
MYVLATDPMLPRPFRIGRVRRETQDTFTLELKPTENKTGFPFRAGQFNMLYVFGVGEVAISISGDPANSDLLVHTTRGVGSVTKAMQKLPPGGTIGVRGPFGSFWPLEEVYGNDILFIAGGIGLAPLRPAMYQVLAQREKFGRVVLLYGTRTPADVLFKSELKRWGGNLELEVYVTVDRATGNWRGNVGVVTSLIRRAPFDPLNTTAMVCGPEMMMRYTVQELEGRGVQAQDIFLSMERNMKCAIGLCGHCQWGPKFLCKDGPVFRYDRIRDLFNAWEI